ncbi:MAG: glycoside hydrolase family 108 protein [Leptothrix ochracea]|uniref:glycoside hydrolase family 108 protein n=1 Tax=Leptothrix ochracea TaxID=735331 RepID=UPI0034E1FCAA
MADFAPALKATLKSEGGYVNDPTDRGGETYCGIARKMNPKWEGWITVDELRKKPNFPKNLDSDANLLQQIARFYKINYWDRVRGDDLKDQHIAESLFDFGVNAGTGTSIKLAQIAAKVSPASGVMNDDSLKALNAIDPELFISKFTLNKVARYVDICKKNGDQKKFIFGWVRRALEGV